MADMAVRLWRGANKRSLFKGRKITRGAFPPPQDAL